MTASPASLDRRNSRSLRERLSGAAGLRGSQQKKVKLRRRELTYLLRNLAALIDNGLPLAKALAVLAKERSLRRRGECLL